MKRGISLLACILASPIFVGSAQGQTLEQVLATAYTSNPTLLAARAQLRAADENVPQALAGWRPTVSLTGDVGRTRLTTTRGTLRSSEALTNRSIGVNLAQPLYDGGGTVAGIAEAENTVLATRAQLLATEQAVFLDVVTAYANVVRDQAVLEENINNVQVMRRQMEAAQDRFRVGEITRTDVAQAEARLAGAVSNRVQAEGNLQASRAAIQNLVGIAPERLTAPPPPPALPASLNEAVGQAAVSNPNVLAAQYTARAATDRIDVIESDLQPQVALNGVVDRAFDEQTRNSEVNALRAVVSVTVPIYEAGLTYARVRQQKHTANQRRIQVEDERSDAVEQATRSWEVWQSARARIDSLGTQVRAAEVALEGVEREAQVGSRTVLDVLDAEQELLEARVALVTASRDERVASYQLLSAVGRLNAVELALPVDLYDPLENYLEVRGKWIGTNVDLIGLPQEQ